MSPLLRKRFVEVSHGQVHVVEDGTGGETVLLLHQTPRSWREFEFVLPLLGASHRAVAWDTPGFGESTGLSPHPQVCDFVAVLAATLDGAGLEAVHLVGHHSGGVIALAFAAAHPDRVASLTLSATPWLDATERAARALRPPVDAVELAGMDSLVTLWNGRAGLYPPDRPDLLRRFLADAIRAAEHREDLHHAFARFPMEQAVPRIGMPVQVIYGEADCAAGRHQSELAAALGVAPMAIVGAGIPMPEEAPEAFARAVAQFVDENSSQRTMRVLR